MRRIRVAKQRVTGKKGRRGKEKERAKSVGIPKEREMKVHKEKPDKTEENNKECKERYEIK